MRLLRALGLVAMLALGACRGGGDSGGSTAAGATGSTAAGVIAVGAQAPAVSMIAAGGESVALADRFGEQDQTIVVFYRGFF